MNKSEIEVDIESRIGSIIEITNQDTQRPPEQGTWYRAVCKITDGDVAYHKSVYYYVYDEGEINEEAFYKDRFPKEGFDHESHISTTEWEDVILASIAAKEQAGAIEKGILKSVNEQKKLAVVEVYMMDSGILKNRLYLVYENKDQLEKFERIIQE